MALTAKKVYAILKRQISDMEAKLNSPLRYRGTVATADLLPLNPDIGDMYNIESKSVYGEAGMNVAWNGVVWDTMGAPIDMSLYFTKEEADTTIQNMVNEYFENNPVKPGATTEQAQQIEQNKKDVASLKEDLSTKITKFYASSQGETHLADSDNRKIQDMMLYGKSEQKQYSGKNLLNPTLQTTTQNGVTCTNNGDGTYTVNGTATGIAALVVYYNFADVYGSASSLKMVGCPSGGSAQKYFLRSYRKGGNPEILDEYGSGISIGSFKESESNIAIIVKSGATVNNLIFKPMLTTDTTATYADFEPYTGGIPSPNPDYPQEIKSVVNPTVKVCGKNLLNLNSYKENVKNGITITPIFNNEELQYLILNGTFKTAEWAVIWIGTLNPGTYTFSTQNSNVKILRNWSEQNNTFTVTDENSVYRIAINSSNMGESVKDVKIYPQLELGSTPSTYEPYHEQTVTLPYTLNAIPVESGGNITIDDQQYIADYVDVERGKLVRNVLVKTFTGNEGWDYSDATDDSKKRFYLEINKKIKSAIGISNYLRSIGADIRKGDNCFAAYTRSLDVRITSIASLAEFKSFLARLDSNGKPLNVLFALDTPEEIDLTQEEISAFKALSTNYPVTNIEVSSDQLDGYTVFNYPISMANGWNYVKKQLNDNRDYIYDMDMQSAEAYVNSEYAVALTELEV
jgi:hypothetical protein